MEIRSGSTICDIEQNVLGYVVIRYMWWTQNERRRRICVPKCVGSGNLSCSCESEVRSDACFVVCCWRVVWWLVWFCKSYEVDVTVWLVSIKHTKPNSARTTHLRNISGDQYSWHQCASCPWRYLYECIRKSADVWCRRPIYRPSSTILGDSFDVFVWEYRPI